MYLFYSRFVIKYYTNSKEEIERKEEGWKEKEGDS